MKHTPSVPPNRAIRAMERMLGKAIFPSSAQRNNAGSVKIAPAATDSPAEPIVCTMLFSRIESLRRITRMIPIEITAAGMEAETVIPTRSPRYALAAPNTIARRIPIKSAVTVNSGTTLSAGIYGLNSFLLLSIFSMSFLLFSMLPCCPHNR